MREKQSKGWDCGFISKAKYQRLYEILLIKFIEFYKE